MIESEGAMQRQLSLSCRGVYRTQPRMHALLLSLTSLPNRARSSSMMVFITARKQPDLYSKYAH